MKHHIKKGDTVRVIAGADKGSEGRVLSVDREKYRAFVEGVNMISAHTKPNTQYPQGGIIKKEASIHLSNLMILDGKGNATRVARGKDKNGQSIRISKKSGDPIK